MFSFKNSPNCRPTVHELLSYYKRQKLSLRDDGTRLIRPIPRPSFMINNDDVETNDLLGKVGQKRNHHETEKHSDFSFVFFSLGSFWSSKKRCL